MIKHYKIGRGYGRIKRVIKMGSRYQFREEEIKAIQEARRKNKDKRAEQR